MYSESDIEAAVVSGAISREAATALRDSVAASRAAPAADEESFRLLTGFNDIFVTIAAVLLLVAVGWIGVSLGQALQGIVNPNPELEELGLAFLFGGVLVAGAAWTLAEYFTRQRRMALPSIILLAAFVGGTGWALFGIAIEIVPKPDERGIAAIFGLVALLTAGAAYAHWRRFHVPITIAALTGALVLTAVALIVAAIPDARTVMLWLTLAAGIAVFAFAMWWDMSDRARITRRSDVAFWLHLGAAPMIAHSIFWLMGVNNGEIHPGTAIGVLALYVLFGLVALAVDRRALLVSSLVYVLYAMSSLFKQFGGISLSMALTALLIGGSLLLLSAFWHPIRRQVILLLPADLRLRLPASDRPVVVAA